MGAGQARLGVAVLAATAALASCGDEEPLPPDPVDREDALEIAETINTVREGLVAGDGEAVCDSLVDAGQRITVRVTADELGVPAGSCEEAVEQLAPSIDGRDRRRFLGPRPYVAGDVDVDPTDAPGFNDTTDTVPEGGPASIQVSCLDGSSNVWFALRQDDGSWKLGVPFCSGR